MTDWKNLDQQMLDSPHKFRMLSSGSFGITYLYENQYVVKFQRETGLSPEQIQRSFELEIKNLKFMTEQFKNINFSRNPDVNVLKSHVPEFVYGDKYIVTKFSPGIQLYDYIQSCSRIDMDIKIESNKWIYEQLIACMKGLHLIGMAHLDFHVSNILVDSERQNITILDFGLGCSGEPCGPVMIGHGVMRAPERKENRRLPIQEAQDDDLYSLGIALLMFTLGKPWDYFRNTYGEQYTMFRRDPAVQLAITTLKTKNIIDLTCLLKDGQRKHCLTDRREPGPFDAMPADDETDLDAIETKLSNLGFAPMSVDSETNGDGKRPEKRPGVFGPGLGPIRAKPSAKPLREAAKRKEDLPKPAFKRSRVGGTTTEEKEGKSTAKRKGDLPEPSALKRSRGNGGTEKKDPKRKGMEPTMESPAESPAAKWGKTATKGEPSEEKGVAKRKGMEPTMESPAAKWGKTATKEEPYEEESVAKRKEAPGSKTERKAEKSVASEQKEEQRKRNETGGGEPAGKKQKTRMTMIKPEPKKRTGAEADSQQQPKRPRAAEPEDSEEPEMESDMESVMESEPDMEPDDVMDSVREFPQETNKRKDPDSDPDPKQKRRKE